VKPSEILKQGLELLETKGWTQGTYARDRYGLSAYRPEQAACYCGIGAIRVAAFGTVSQNDLSPQIPSYLKARRLLDVVTPYDIPIDRWVSWQDKPERTFPEVKAKFLQAIALAEGVESKEVTVG
jgi:hypothetical protein